MKLYKTMQIDGWAVLPQTRLNIFYDVEEPFRLDVMQPFEIIQVDGCAAPQHLLSRPSSIDGVKKSFRFVAMQTINNV